MVVAVLLLVLEVRLKLFFLMKHENEIVAANITIGKIEKKATKITKIILRN